VQTLAFDATDHDAVRKTEDRFEEAHGAITILSNNAGMQQRGAIGSPAPGWLRLTGAVAPSAFRHWHRLSAASMRPQMRMWQAARVHSGGV